MTPGRERGLTALLCAAGAGLALLAAGRPWATVRARETVTSFTLDLTGKDLGTAPGALGWAALAGLAALFATRGKARAAVGALLTLFGVAIAVLSVTAVDESTVRAVAGERSALLRIAATPAIEIGPWWAVSLAGGALIALAGLVALVRGPRWPGMSARYERQDAAPSPRRRTPAPDVPAEPADLWKSMDRGEDPTGDGAPGDGAPRDPAAEERKA